VATTTDVDVIDQLAGLGADSPVAALRRQKPDLVAFAQGSYAALLEPADPGAVSPIERHAIAYRVGLLTGFESVATRHRDRLRELGASENLLTAIADFPASEGLEPRFSAMLTYADRVTSVPGLAESAHIAALHEAGLTATEIVTIAQLIGFLAYQVRTIAVARAFGEDR
jgi:CMD domain protein